MVKLFRISAGVFFWVKVCLSRFLCQIGSLEGRIQDNCWVIKRLGVNCLEVVSASTSTITESVCMHVLYLHNLQLGIVNTADCWTSVFFFGGMNLLPTLGSEGSTFGETFTLHFMIWNQCTQQLHECIHHLASCHWGCRKPSLWYHLKIGLNMFERRLPTPQGFFRARSTFTLRAPCEEDEQDTEVRFLGLSGSA